MQELVDQPLTPNNAPQPGQVKLLRPLPPRPTLLGNAQVPDKENPEMDTYRLFHPGKTADLWNEAIKNHVKLYPECSGKLMWDESGDIQRGLAWRELLKCDKCSFVSKRHNLYTEVKSNKRGSKTAAINIGSQVGMKHTSMSNTGLRKTLLAANTPAPSKSSMQKSANKVGAIVVDSNQKDMKRICEDLQDIQLARGLDKDSPIDVELDSRYNNSISSSSSANSPYQPGMQVTQIVAENSTKRKLIISANIKSKLCQICALKGTGVISDMGSDDHICTANLEASDSIGSERRWARESLTNLKNRGIHVSTITTDPDTSVFLAAGDLFKTSVTKTEPNHQIDTRHVQSNQRKFTKSIDFSNKMFNSQNKTEAKVIQGRFANDLAARCHAEHSLSIKNYGGDVAKVNTHMANIPKTISACYTGSHSLCRLHSLACRGLKTNNWVLKSAYLSNPFKITPNTTDSEKLDKCILYRLGKPMLKKTERLLTTQKCEAVNRAIGVTAPKNITFSRNHESRVHAAIRGINSGISEAILSECQGLTYHSWNQGQQTAIPNAT